MPSVPFLSEDRNVLIMPALTLLSSLLNASASSASLPSWLTKTSGLDDPLEGSSSVSNVVFALSDSAMFSRYDFSRFKRPAVEHPRVSASVPKQLGPDAG
jgi:hypothetical protein